MDSCWVSGKLGTVVSGLKSRVEWIRRERLRMSDVVGSSSTISGAIVGKHVGMGAPGAMRFDRTAMDVGPLPRARSGDGESCFRSG